MKHCIDIDNIDVIITSHQEVLKDGGVPENRNGMLVLSNVVDTITLYVSDENGTMRVDVSPETVTAIFAGMYKIASQETLINKEDYKP